MTPVYAPEPDLAAIEFQAVLNSSGLGERRPVADLVRLDRMLRSADIIVTARVDGQLVGISRALCDFSFCCYLSDLAVDPEFQGRGIGRRLIAETHAVAGPQSSLILLAAPSAESYYPHIGMTQRPECWVLRREI